jgi:hypothetical protein
MFQQASMHDVTIRNRADGVVELGPRIAPLDPADRLMVVVTLILVACGLFVSGALRAEAVAVIIVSALAGELVLGVKGFVLLLLRPLADVHEVPRLRSRPR